MQAMGFCRSSHSVFECQYHIVWTTKYRKRALRLPHEREYCAEILRRTAAEYRMKIESVEVDEDHVHLYILIPPQKSLGRAVGILKRRYRFFSISTIGSFFIIGTRFILKTGYSRVN